MRSELFVCFLNEHTHHKMVWILQNTHSHKSTYSLVPKHTVYRGHTLRQTKLLDLPSAVNRSPEKNQREYTLQCICWLSANWQNTLRAKTYYVRLHNKSSDSTAEVTDQIKIHFGLVYVHLATCEMNKLPATVQKVLIKRGRVCLSSVSFTGAFFLHWRLGIETAPSVFTFNHDASSPPLFFDGALRPSMSQRQQKCCRSSDSQSEQWFSL